MIPIPKTLSSRSTLFGFIIVILLSIVLVVGLLIQVDTWSSAGFELVKKNMQQARLVLRMRSVVQKRELIMQRMMNIADVFERDREAMSFYELEGAYLTARQQLMQTEPDEALLENLRQLDAAVGQAYPYHNNLVEALVFGDIDRAELDRLIRNGRMARKKVLSLLDQIVENQESSYEKVISEYDHSRRLTLLLVGVVFSLIVLVVVYAVRTSGRQFRHISRLSIIDEVSGIYNRRYFDMVLEEEWKRSMREYTPLSLLMLDIDFFKDYNDSFGHQMGDDCLYSIGKIISGQLKRATDISARYGGEEFAVILPSTTLEHARLLAERLRRAVEEARIKAGNDSVSPWLTVSIGVATATAEFEQPSSVLVKAADKCLYQSKRSGRNRVSVCVLDDLN